MGEKIEERRPELAIKYARDPKEYDLVGETGSTKEATVYKAKYASISSENSVIEEDMVGIKVFDTHKIEDFYSLINEVHIAKRCCHHGNIQGVHCSFKVENKLWVVMPYLSGLTLKSMMSSSFPHGLPSSAIPYILKETLTALQCIHAHRGDVHGDVDVDNVFLDKNLKIKLGFSSLNPRSRVSEVKPSWMIDPDLISHHNKGHNQKSDIWMFGLLALDLFCGPSNREALESIVTDVVINRRKNKPKFGNSFRKLGFSCFGGSMKKNLPESLGEMVAKCLSIDPSKRPSTSELMNHKFFEKGCASDNHVEKVLKKLCKDVHTN